MRRIRERERNASLLTSLRRRSRGAGHVLDDAHGAIDGHERSFGDSPDVGLGDLVNPVDRVEPLAPVIVPRLIYPKLESPSYIARMPAAHIRLGAGLDHLQFFVADVFLH